MTPGVIFFTIKVMEGQWKFVMINDKVCFFKGSVTEIYVYSSIIYKNWNKVYIKRGRLTVENKMKEKAY